MKVCLVCNIPLPIESAYNRKYCDICKITVKKAQSKESYNRNKQPLRVIKCVECSEIITEIRSSKTKYCDPCRVIVRKRQTAEQYKRRKSEGRLKSGLPVYGFCEICNKYGRLYHDHDNSCCYSIDFGYRCGYCERGLLCPSCNTVLGLSRDSISTLQQAIKYLERFDSDS